MTLLSYFCTNPSFLPSSSSLQDTSYNTTRLSKRFWMTVTWMSKESFPSLSLKLRMRWTLITCANIRLNLGHGKQNNYVKNKMCGKLNVLYNAYPIIWFNTKLLFHCVINCIVNIVYNRYNYTLRWFQLHGLISMERTIGCSIKSLALFLFKQYYRIALSCCLLC